MNRPRADFIADTVGFTLNGRKVRAKSPRVARLSDVLRDELGLTGTKVGCNAGDCGACTVLVDGKQLCSCLTALGQVEGRSVETVEGLNRTGRLCALQIAFHKHGAAQCGICTPGMLMAASALLKENAAPGRQQVEDALGGVLCRCTGYQKIVEAMLDVANAPALDLPPAVEQAVGARAAKVDGIPRLTGAEKYGADGVPADALWIKVIRSPHHRASFRFLDFREFLKSNPGIACVLTARDVPRNGFGIYPDIKDQPVLAEREARFRGEAVAAIVGTKESIGSLDEASFPVRWTPLPPVLGLDAATDRGAPLVHPDKPGNLLLDGEVKKGNVEDGFSESFLILEASFHTAFVEHAYIEPEAGWARRAGDRLEVHVSTQTPYMDRDEVARVMNLAPEAVRIVPTACGGGFGGKLDVSVQPLVALGAWLTRRPVACVFTRRESMASTTKRHPARLRAKFGCDADGRLLACEVDARFDTGAYASWGPTVATRVPIHASGPYAVPNVRTRGRAWFTNCHPSGAFRGFGVPQGAIAHEAMMDELADRLGIDRLEMRRRNALKAGERTATGQLLEHSAGLVECLDRLEPDWISERAESRIFNLKHPTLKHGVGIGCMWYGIGNTALSNPSTIRIGLSPDGTLTLYSGAVDIGQGSSTTLTQIAADALGLPMSQVRLVMGDTDLTADAGKTSASRQAFVSGKAAELAGFDLRRKLFEYAGAPEDEWRDRRYRLSLEGRRVAFRRNGITHRITVEKELVGEGRFDPPTAPCDENGQGSPYATYAFAAQIAVVEVDLELGTTKVLRIHAAHDVGRAINPIQVEGQIQGGALQGLGLALMEEYVPGRTENLHDYLVPTIGDAPGVHCVLVEDPEPLGPYGAKGVGEPGLIPTAPAILGAIHDATGVRMRQVPVLPHRLLEALKNARS